VKPGFVDTPMTRDFPKGLLWSTPERVASGIVRAIDRRSHDVYLPGFWRWVMAAIRALPERIFLRTRL
jgi:short-subunit dehydrogenase